MSSSEAGERDKGLALWTVAVAVAVAVAVTEGARKVRVVFGIVGRVRAFVRALVRVLVRTQCGVSKCLSV
jgi:hypothetical protein